MRKFLYILTLMLLLGCKSKKVTSEVRKVTSEAVGVRVTDSTTEEQQRGEVHTFDLRQAHSYELTLEGDSLEVKSEKRRACSASHERDELQALIIVRHELKLLNTWKQVCDSRQRMGFTFYFL